MIRMLLVLACVAASAVGIVPAAADEIDVLPADLWDSYQNTPPTGTEKADDEANARISAAYCDRFGVGYELVPGTQTCIKVGGHVQMDVYIRGRR